MRIAKKVRIRAVYPKNYPRKSQILDSIERKSFWKFPCLRDGLTLPEFFNAKNYGPRNSQNFELLTVSQTFQFFSKATLPYRKFWVESKDRVMKSSLHARLRLNFLTQKVISL